MSLLYPEARPSYEPMDELLQEPTIRILRALSRLAWCTMRDLTIALDLAGEDENKYQQQLYRLYLRGEVSRRPSTLIEHHRGAARNFDYCIGDAGRARLARELERANPERELAGRSEDDPGFLRQLERRAETGSAARRARREGRTRRSSEGEDRDRTRRFSEGEDRAVDGTEGESPWARR